MLKPIDPLFEHSLRQITITVKQLTRAISQAAVDCEVQRIREAVSKYEDYDPISPAQLVDLILEDIGGGDLDGA